MSIVRRKGESQRAVVERVLREQGEIATFAVLYGMRDEADRPTSITRLAAIVCDLRADGWDLETLDKPGELAVYRLKGYSKPAAAPTPLPVWLCLNCGTKATAEPEPALGGMGYGPCLNCHTKRYFQRRAA